VLGVGFEVTMILTLVGIRFKGGLVPAIAGGTIIAVTLVIFAVSLIFVIMGRYATVSARTQEIGILRFLGASSAYIFNLLLQETLLIAIPGTAVGIAMTYVGKWLMTLVLHDIVTLNIVHKWWPIAGAISVGSALLGAFIPAWRAIKLDVIQAISSEE
jgi:putative ABC transport system permease protein